MTSPSRRRFLVAGGASIVGAATVAACSSSPTVTTSGTVASTAVTPTAPLVRPTAKELAAGRALLRTATSVERSLAAFYERFVAASYLDAAAKQWGGQFGTAHAESATRLAALTKSAGGAPYLKTNAYLDTQLIKPGMALADGSSSSSRLIALASTLEQAAASTETLAVSSLPRQPDRSGIMEVGAANSRRSVFWTLMDNPGDFAGAIPAALYSLENALGAQGDLSS